MNMVIIGIFSNGILTQWLKENAMNINDILLVLRIM